MLGVVQRQVNEIREVVLVAKQRLGKRLGCPSTMDLSGGRAGTASFRRH